MDLSKRLQKVSEMVPMCHTVADIGTDHGFALISLLKLGKIEKGIASDNKAMPLEKARRNAEEEGQSEVMSFRLGSGFETLEPGEANGAILAGMGGILMVELLESAQAVVEKFEFLLLQPAQNPEILRKYLYQNNFEIMDEELVQEERRFYEYFLVRKSKKDVDIYPSICEYSIGSILLEKKHPLLQVYIESKIQELAVISEMIHGTTENAKIKMERLNHKMRELRRVKDEYLC